MNCPKCASTNVTSAAGKSGIWKCLSPDCGIEFNRDAQARRLGVIR
jgi:ribosomal protein L37AE/L43A